MSHPIVGIDLGTTYSLLGRLVDGKPELLPNGLGGTLHASAVYFDEAGVVHVGPDAKHRAVLQPERAAQAFKRDMGTDAVITVAGKKFRAEELSSLVLRALKEGAEAHWGQPVERAVISVPAYFGEPQRQATRQAAELAGLEVVRLINEPTAAALAYGVTRQDDARIAVLDLGGGTFDVTLLQLSLGVIEIQSSAGDLFLGGIDFDRALAAALRRLSSAQGTTWSDDAATEGRLLEAAERCKKQLSTAERADVLLSDLLTSSGRRQTLRLTMTRATAEEAWAGLTERLLRPVRQALGDAGWEADDVDEVVLVGGSSRLPLVQRELGTYFGKEPTQPLPPDEAVAVGATLTAGLVANDAALEDVVVTDVAPFSMGIALAHENGPELVQGIYEPIIERGTVIPCCRTRVVTPISKGQKVLKLDVYQGEHAIVARNTLLGSLEMTGLDAEVPFVEVSFTYNLDGILEVEATRVSDGKAVSVFLGNSARSLTEADKQKFRAQMQGLKIHPADKMENAAILSQAEVLYEGSLGELRARTGEMIVAFRAALQSRDEGRIEQARGELRDFLRDYW